MRLWSLLVYSQVRWYKQLEQSISLFQPNLVEGHAPQELEEQNQACHAHQGQLHENDIHVCHHLHAAIIMTSTSTKTSPLSIMSVSSRLPSLSEMENLILLEQKGMNPRTLALECLPHQDDQAARVQPLCLSCNEGVMIWKRKLTNFNLKFGKLFVHTTFYTLLESCGFGANRDDKIFA